MAEYDADRLRECMFGEVTGPIIAELEGGPKSASYLAEKSGLDAGEIGDRLSYMVQHGFLTLKDGVYAADAGRLARAVEDDDNYGGVVDGITQMDSYLN